jgi:hypothetical protein
VLTSDPLPCGVIVSLEITLPSLRGEHSGACLRTVGHVVRTEPLGFAALADMGFRMQFPGSRAEDSARRKSDGEGSRHEASSSQRKVERAVLVSRFSM